MGEPKWAACAVAHGRTLSLSNVCEVYKLEYKMPLHLLALVEPYIGLWDAPEQGLQILKKLKEL